MVHSFGAQDRGIYHTIPYEVDQRLEPTPDNTLVHDPDEMEEFCEFLEEEHTVQCPTNYPHLASCTDL